jgi:hypothetical protein
MSSSSSSASSSSSILLVSLTLNSAESSENYYGLVVRFVVFLIWLISVMNAYLWYSPSDTLTPTSGEDVDVWLIKSTFNVQFRMHHKS